MRTILDEILYDRGHETTCACKQCLQEELNINDSNTYLAFTQEVARIAKQEQGRWGNGSIKETNSGIRSVLKDYWVSGLKFSGSYSENLISMRTPWSAAFISWVMRRVGAGTYFKYSAAHWKYIADAKQKRQKNDWNTVFWAYRINEKKPRIGDLVCNSRAGSGINYDNVEKGGATHCDIVTEVQPGKIIVVGGNVDDSVKHKTILLNGSGYIDASRHPNHFAVLSIW